MPLDERLLNLLHTLATDPQLSPSENLQAQRQIMNLCSSTRTTSAPIRKPRIDIDIDRLLEVPGVVLYGSRALGINLDKSDYDIALSYETHRNIYDWLLDNNTHISSNHDYFTSTPEAGYHTFFQHITSDIKIDIIFVHNDEDLDVIRSSVQDLQSIPSYMLAHKPFRIEAYNRALQHRGWKSKETLVLPEEIFEFDDEPPQLLDLETLNGIVGISDRENPVMVEPTREHYGRGMRRTYTDWMSPVVQTSAQATQGRVTYRYRPLTDIVTPSPGTLAHQERHAGIHEGDSS